MFASLCSATSINCEGKKYKSGFSSGFIIRSAVMQYRLWNMIHSSFNTRMKLNWASALTVHYPSSPLSGLGAESCSRFVKGKNQMWFPLKDDLWVKPNICIRSNHGSIISPSSYLCCVLMVARARKYTLDWSLVRCRVCTAFTLTLTSAGESAKDLKMHVFELGK